MKTIVLYIRQGLIILSLSLVCGFILSSCQDDDMQLPDGGTKMLTFSVKVPGSSSGPSTYALSTSDENEVKTIEILLFNTSGNYVYQPIYSNVIATDALDSKIKTFSVKVPEGTYNMVILANSRQPLTNILGLINVNDTKASVLSKLVITNNSRWNTSAGTGGYIPIPMWGEISSITVNASTPANNPVTLVRMLSKIDVALTHVNATNNFKLKSIRLYNYNNQGRITPLAANWNSSLTTVTDASVPSTSSLALGPLLYDGTSITTTDVSSIGEIYAFEAIKGTSATLSSATCLVIGGIYGSDSQLTYYRIDFAQTTSSTTYLDLLRNYNYKVNITAVSGPGLATPLDAFNSRPVNIKAEILQWNDAQLTNIVVDGQYMLGVSQGEFSLPRNERTASNSDNSLLVTTDYPTGWVVDKIVDAGSVAINWLSLVSTSGTAITSGVSGSTTTTKLKLTENTSGSARVGFIHLKAGRLTYVVKVTQGTQTEIALSVKNTAGTQNITELVFVEPIGTQPVAQQFKLKWSPTSTTVSATNNAVGTAFSFDGASDQPGLSSWVSITDPSGEKTFTIRPTAMASSDLTVNPFLEKMSKIDFTIYNGESYMSQSIFLRQSTYNLVFANTLSSYWTNGSTYTFNVRSNANWRIKSVSENTITGTGTLLNLQVADNLKVGTTGGNNTTTGTPITFRAVNNIVNLSGRVTVVFESVDSPKKFNDVTLYLDLINEYYPAVHKGWAGSNIYYDPILGHLTFDDVGVTTHKNYQGVYFLGGSLYGISPQNAYTTSTPIYPPSTTGNATSGLTWSGIPRLNSVAVISNPPSGKTEKDRARLYEVTDSATGIGDICRYLTEKGWAPTGKKWRMPTATEFDAASGSYTLVGTFAETPSNKADGSFTINSGYNKAAIGTPFFPASGYRDYLLGALQKPNDNGLYWTSSPTSTGLGSYMFSFTAGNSIFYVAYFHDFGSSVRCVVE
ncbi:MAG: fimbrial protein [Dysgonomonas sp.]